MHQIVGSIRPRRRGIGPVGKATGANSGLTGRTGPLGNVTSYTHNPNRNLDNPTEMLIHTTSLAYNA